MSSAGTKLDVVVSGKVVVLVPVGRLPKDQPTVLLDGGLAGGHA